MAIFHRFYYYAVDKRATYSASRSRAACMCIHNVATHLASVYMYFY